MKGAPSFQLESFEWTAGGFVVAGRWRADVPIRLGRARLVLEVDGRIRRLGARGVGATTAGPEPAAWQARFPYAARPETVGPCELELGADLALELPAPVIADDEDVVAAEDAFGRLAAERAETEATTERLVASRAALDADLERFEAARTAAEATTDGIAETARERAEAAATAATSAAIARADEASTAATDRAQAAEARAQEIADRAVEEARAAETGAREATAAAEARAQAIADDGVTRATAAAADAVARAEAAETHATDVAADAVARAETAARAAGEAAAEAIVAQAVEAAQTAGRRVATEALEGAERVARDTAERTGAETAERTSEEIARRAAQDVAERVADTRVEQHAASAVSAALARTGPPAQTAAGGAEAAPLDAADRSEGPAGRPTPLDEAALRSAVEAAVARERQRWEAERAEVGAAVARDRARLAAEARPDPETIELAVQAALERERAALQTEARDAAERIVRQHLTAIGPVRHGSRDWTDVVTAPSHDGSLPAAPATTRVAAADGETDPVGAGRGDSTAGGRYADGDGTAEQPAAGPRRQPWSAGDGAASEDTAELRQRLLGDDVGTGMLGARRPAPGRRPPVRPRPGLTPQLSQRELAYGLAAVIVVLLVLVVAVLL